MQVMGRVHALFQNVGFVASVSGHTNGITQAGRDREYSGSKCYTVETSTIRARYASPSVYIVKRSIENFVHYWFEFNVLELQWLRFFFPNGALLF